MHFYSKAIVTTDFNLILPFLLSDSIARTTQRIKMRLIHRYVGKNLWIPMILVLFAYCIAGSVHGEKIRKSTVRSLMQQPTQFSATPLSAQGSYGDECQASSSRVLQLSNSVEIFSKVASEREQEATSENKIFHPIIVWSEMLR